jgi:uridine kinase
MEECPLPLLVLVCGPSGCGKTTVANELAAALGNAVVIHQDDYFRHTFLNYAERTDDSYESPASVCH